MHCSVWRFEGDPDDLERRYLALVAEIPEIGFLGQPLDPAEALGGLTHGHNALGVL